jgi:hypothetical protein
MSSVSIDQCIDLLNSYLSEVGVDNEIKAAHYSVVANCVTSLLNLIINKLNYLTNAGLRLSDDVNNQLSKCKNLVNSYAMPKTMSIIQPEHENMLIDMLKCVENLYYMLPSFILWMIMESGKGTDSGAYTDLTPVISRASIINSPIPYFSTQLSPAGGYVLTPPPSYTTAVIGSLQTSAWGLNLFIKNLSQGYAVNWTDSNGPNPCAKGSLYSDGWILFWIEDRCPSGADWDYNDIALGARAEILDNRTFVHAIAVDQDHWDSVMPCATAGDTTLCGPGLNSYSGPARIMWEAWIQVS